VATDRYGLTLSTASQTARDAYVRGYDLALTLYPGAIQAFDAALEADPAFAMAHVGKAGVLMRHGETAPARAELQAAKALAAGISAREESHIAFTDLVFSGQAAAALTAGEEHLATWPRDAIVLSQVGNPNGLIGISGQIGQKHRVATLMDRLAADYGDDYWFLSYHGMALSEDGRHAAARPIIERSIALNPRNAHATHSYAHVCYEGGDLASARAYFAAWLPDYPHDGFFHGHLSWHASLCEILAGDWDNAQRLYRDGIALDRHSGGPQNKMQDTTAFLWRSELAGYPRDAAGWRGVYDLACGKLPRPGSSLADLHVILAQAVAGDDAGLETRSRQMADMTGEGRYPSGDYLPAVARGIRAFERRDFDAAIAALAPLMGQNERIGGSRAQHDLVEFTLLKAYLEAGRPDAARDLLTARRPGAAPPAVAGLAAIH
jgi:tetratricopeptide (TPR) repeat protein